MDNEVYYKLYQNNLTGLITIVCMQWFDEPDYYQDRFVRNSSGFAHRFETEKEAIDKLNEWYAPEQIDPEYRLITRIDLVRD